MTKHKCLVFQIQYIYGVAVVQQCVYIPLAVTDRYNGQLAHKMFLTTLETTTRVYVQVWGPKETCHDTLEPIRNIGRVPTWAREAPGGRSSRMKF